MTSISDYTRDLRIDFLRGIALLVIFSDHIPGNAMASYTPVAFGLSDMAEVFVFLSGYACGISYGRRLRERGFGSCLEHAWWRAAQVYGAKLFVTLLAITVLVVLEQWVNARFFGTNWSIALVKEYPLATILELESLRLEIQQYCVLALYIPLLIMLPIVILGLEKIPQCTLLVSACLYISTQLFPESVTLPHPWREAMYFNPFAWQFLFYGAAALALHKSDIRLRFSLRWLGVIACLVTLLSLHFFFGGEAWDTNDIWKSKKNLGWLRVIHFSAAGTVAWKMIPSSEALSRWIVCRPLIICGRFSLVGYCAAGILDLFGEAALGAFSQAWPMQVLVNLSGWLGCLLVTAAWQWRTRYVRA